MDLASVYAAAFAWFMLAAADLGVWVWVNAGLSLNYRRVTIPVRRRGFPRRKRIVRTKLAVGAVVIVSFVVTDHLGAAQHMGLAGLTLALCLAFVALSAWDSISAFRDYAARNLPPAERGGYIER